MADIAVGTEQEIFALVELADRALKSRAEQLWLASFVLRLEQMKQQAQAASVPPPPNEF